MLIKHEKRRLLVGYRRCDWSEVWYDGSPHIAPTADSKDSPELLLYHSPTAPSDSPKNPLAAEVNWLPQFDCDNFEANKAAGRRHLQQLFIYRCWQYMESDDRAILKENEFARPDQLRWKTWKKAADCEKASRMNLSSPSGGSSPDHHNDQIAEYDQADDEGFADGRGSVMGPPPPRKRKAEIKNSRRTKSRTNLSDVAHSALRRQPSADSLSSDDSEHFNNIDEDDVIVDDRVASSIEVNQSNALHAALQSRIALKPEMVTERIRSYTPNAQEKRPQSAPMSPGTLARYNGTMNEEEALARAREASKEPQYQGGAWGFP